MNRFRLSIITLLIMALGMSGTGLSHTSDLTDIDSNWAKDHIRSLAARKIISGYPDGTFRPEQPVTRAEFAKMVTTAFPIVEEKNVSFNDLSDHWARQHILTLAGAGIVDGYPNGTFRPDENISRAEITSMLVRILKLHDVKDYHREPSFVDVSPSHWAFDAIETALRLKIIPPYVRGSFEPSRPATRAETAAMLDEAMRLQTTRGTLDYLETGTQILGVRTDTGIRDFAVNDDTVLHRNTNGVTLENFVVGDAIYVVADRFGSPQFVKTNGVVTRQDVASKVTGITRGLLTPSDIQSIIQGDWQALGDSLKNTLYDQLLAQGLTPVEAGAVMTQDWDSLKDYARDRLVQVVALQLGITADLAFALLEQDWDRARELAQVEALQHLLGQFLVDLDTGV